MGPIVNNKYYPYVVTDDGIAGHRYSVRVFGTDDTTEPNIFVGSGMSNKNASMVAEALAKTLAGTPKTTLVENRLFNS